MADLVVKLEVTVWIRDVFAFQALHQELRALVDAFRKDGEAAAVHIYIHLLNMLEYAGIP